jgi:hypothetical protein
MQVTCKRFELGRGGALVPVDEAAGKGLPVGTVLHWGGNMGWSERDFCVLFAEDHDFGGHYHCFDMDEPEKNAVLHRVEYSSVKRKDDPNVWHRQHFFLTDRKCTQEEVTLFTAEHIAQKGAMDDAKAKADAETARLTEIGKRLWRELGFEGAEHIIIAEHEQDDSDIMTDYHGSHTTETVVLARSEHGRDLFNELRKAAARIPETACYGPGCGIFKPYVQIATDIPNDNGRAYWKGQHSHWHHELDEPSGKRLEFHTKAEAEAFIAAAPKPMPITFNDGAVKAEFSWAMYEDEIEHREKYSGGHGYYLGLNRHSGWQVRKVGVGTDGGYFVALAKRHDHLTPKPKAETSPAVAPSEVDGVTVTENDEKNGVEIRFPSRPADAVLADLKAHGWRWSRFAGCWYNKRTDETKAFAARIAAG